MGVTDHSETERAESEATRPLSGSRAYHIFAALIGGIILGALSTGLPGTVQGAALQVTNAAGGMWLNALQMTVIPLIVALMVTAVAKGADARKLAALPRNPLSGSPSFM
jgi:proton glutamate symport protein